MGRRGPEVSLKRLGLQATTLLDYPGKVAAMVFTMGCPLRCPYCHNPQLVHGSPPAGFLAREEVLRRLARRRHLLQGVVITGGEPLRHHDIGGLLDDVHALGLPVKLDTCGWYPAALAGVLEHPGLQYVAMDIKTLPEHYGRVAAGRGLGGTVLSRSPAIRESVAVLRNWRDAQPERGLEYRTVCAPGVVDPGDLAGIARMLQPGDRWRLSQFQPGSCLDPTWNARTPFDTAVLEQAAAAACRRGVDAWTVGV
ncbi:anaerobic ribonucleoside-triphosphate reductase activating protein [Spirochaeta africana]|uniref:Anaerobic ribonucleoside-triphosphate reductase activating protein n=1 Tax=Spirochaeta africana (strain ATCC 700263 / DSM 8902 / Z-7692) TaxID=889378 RepID=H9ULE2_SPIAZ|nr:anaerobic ribonucleoside-triphosphate reductase activating protein [Spirochaeta africana]AFG38335.1 anaerobic ribonucleoside-triphosphate reductase activating protein [Spirochaeta africana DSM 8902]